MAARFCSHCGVRLTFIDAAREVTGRSPYFEGTIEEITQCKPTEASLRSRNEANVLELIATRTHNAVILTDAAGRIEWLDEGFVQLTGYSLDEVRGRTPGSVLQGPQTNPQVCAEMRQAIRAGRGFNAEILNYHKSGRSFWMQIMAQPILDEAGRVTQFMAVESDVTQRKLSEEALLLSESRLRLALNVAEMLFWDWAIGANVVTFSHDYGGYYGLPSTGTVIRNDESLLKPVHPDDRGPLMEAFVRTRETGQVFEIEFRGPVRQGEQSWYFSRGQILEMGDDRPQRMVGVTQEITRRKQAEEIIRRSNKEQERHIQDRTKELTADEHRLNEVQSLAQMWSWTEDLGTGRRLWSDSMYVQLGIDRSNVEPSFEALLALLHPDDRPIVKDRYLGLRAGFDQPECELRFLRSDGQIVVTLSRSRAIRDAAGQLVRIEGTDLNITERKQTEMRLAESEARYRSLIEDMNDGMFVVDMCGTVSFANPALASILGFEQPEQVVGKSFFEFLAPGMRNEVGGFFRQAVESRQTRESTIVEIVRPDGSNATVEVRSKIAMADNAIVGMKGIVRDVTERKRAEQAIQEAHKRLSFALEGGELGMWDWSPQTGAVVYSHLWAQMLEYRPDEIESDLNFFKQHIHPADLPGVVERLMEHVEGRSPQYQSEHRLRSKSGEWRWVLDRGKVTERDGNGLAVRATGVVSDITERKRAEQELSKRAHRLDLLTAELPLVLWEATASAGVFRTEWTSSNSERVLGVAAEEFVNKSHWMSYIHPDDLGSLKHPCPPAAGDKISDVWLDEYRWLRPDGSTIHLQSGVSVIPATDDTLHLVGFVLDITDNKIMEQQVRELRDTLAHANRLGTLNEIASGLAHELNQPLSAIHLDASTALFLSNGLDSPELQKHLQHISEQSFRAGEIVRRMRASIRRDSSRKEPKNINHLIKEILNLLGDYLQQFGVTVELNLSAKLPPVVVDAIQIQQVLVNLIRNAAEAMVQNVDQARVISIQTEMTESEIRVSITDTGCGIDPDFSSRLFFPFQTTTAAGLGLGLVACRTIIESHCGHIEARPNPGRGTTFVFTVPVD